MLVARDLREEATRVTDKRIGERGSEGKKVGERKRSRAAGNAVALRQVRNERTALH